MNNEMLDKYEICATWLAGEPARLANDSSRPDEQKSWNKQHQKS